MSTRWNLPKKKPKKKIFVIKYYNNDTFDNHVLVYSMVQLLREDEICVTSSVSVLQSLQFS